ncbi:MAG: N5-carboxyaminoimidazole ribonucleotide synthase [Micavibrio sp.]|nr:N5-carboxyaminoimidazole ribonucleotide synthase [Micavibrio sp.]
MVFVPKTIGILGGGQLGRMAAMAAFRLGMRVCAYTDEEDSPISQIVPFTFVGRYDDKKKLQSFAESVDAITYEFENIPVETIRYLQKFKPVYPDDRVLEIAQHRVSEKKFLNDIGIPTTRWAVITRAGDITRAMEDMDFKAAILKTSRFGYDGKGQVSIGRGEDPKAAWKSLNTTEAILEEKVAFTSEVSVIIARDKLSQTAIYGPILNEHKNHILAKSTVPAPLPAHLAEKARNMTLLLAEAIDLIGVLCLELFVTGEGQLLANEIAPRPHNSGHWTIEACTTSQFEQQVRTVVGMQIGGPNRHSDAVMINLIGDDVDRLAKYYEQANATVHLYGKLEAREGRKMGHITMTTPLSAQPVMLDETISEKVVLN